MATSAHRVIERARTEATLERARAIEAEHLLLALVGHGTPALSAAGLIRATLAAADLPLLRAVSLSLRVSTGTVGGGSDSTLRTLVALANGAEPVTG